MKRSYQSLVVLFLLLVVNIVASLMIGTPFIPFDQLAEVFQGNGSAIQELIVYEFRAPRLLISLLAGMCLGISGFILQGVTRNRLADAGILGINAGAGFFVMIYLGFYANQTFPFLLLIVAFLGGLLAALLVYLFAYTRNSFLG